MRLLKFFIILPVLTLLWGYSNSIGATSYLAKITGLPDASSWTIPGIDKIIDASEAVNGVKAKAEERARRAALAALKDQVEQRYGPEAANAIPEDLPLKKIKRLRPDDFASLAALGTALDLPDIQALAEEQIPDLPEGDKGKGDGKDPKPDGNGGGAKPGDVPFMNTKAYNEARDLLPTLAVKGKAPMTGYAREEFGSEWSDSAGSFFWTDNSCDTRNDVLQRDLVKIKFEKGSKCEVASGVLPYDPYTGQRNRTFDANDDEYATDLDIEHVVALGNSWVTGSFKWTEAKRAALANDPINLFAADPSANRQKGDADAATWLPANKPFRCAYVSQQITVKAKYGLWVAPAEKDAMVRVLDGCPA